MTGGVDKRQVRFSEIKHGLLRKDGNSALALNRMRVEEGVSLVNSPERLYCARGVEKSLG